MMLAVSSSNYISGWKFVLMMISNTRNEKGMNVILDMKGA
jgi:hypothetical protein